ncbi:hypothetical protein N9V96_03510, partial [Polaribacter sp.]|nr:hypothetical protein [Polaribacter sp.]
MKKFLLTVLVALATIMTNAQGVAMVKVDNIAGIEKSRTYEESSRVVPVMNLDAYYSYKLDNRNVLVEFKNGEYKEFYNGKQYYVRASYEWLSEDE